MARSRNHTGPALYPRVPFYVLKVIQLLSSFIVAGVMFFFIAHLNYGHYVVPWMFYFVSCPLLYPQPRALGPLEDEIRRRYLLTSPPAEQLQGSALATIISNIAMGLWLRFRPPAPLTTTIVNAILFSLWTTGFGFLVDSTKATIPVPCNTANWGDSRGIQVCSLYKTLLVGTIFGL